MLGEVGVGPCAHLLRGRVRIRVRVRVRVRVRDRVRVRVRVSVGSSADRSTPGCSTRACAKAGSAATVSFLGALIVVWNPLLEAFVDKRPKGFDQAP